MRIVEDIAQMRQIALETRAQGMTIGFVPTMGALHPGHLNLMRAARPNVDRLAVSVFVNPTQFAPGEDLQAYPRDFESDRVQCEQMGVDWMFYPTPQIMYPPGYQTFVEVEQWGQRLCGRSRPTHFRGVATVVLKLFNIVQPTDAWFGWKDAQQLLIIRKMVADLNAPVRIHGVQIAREADGLAMSSRNAYLTERERAEAPALARALNAARALVLAQPGVSAEQARQTIRAIIESETSGSIDYIEVVSMETLEPMARVEEGTMIALAVKFGQTRLIDNLRLEKDANA